MNGGTKARLLAAAVLCLPAVPGVTQLQEIPIRGPASRLSSEEHYPPPEDNQVKVRLEGSQMIPLPAAKFKVKELVIHMYTQTGKLQAVAEAPECIYDQFDGIASSTGHLTLKLMDDKIHTEASDGFCWQQGDGAGSVTNDNVLSLTNVVTIIKNGAWKGSLP